MEHFHKSIRGWNTFWRLYEQAVKEASDGAHFVEVGSYLGRSAAFMAVEIINSGKDIRFDCIDPWDDGGPDLKHKVAQMRKVPFYEQFLRNIEPVRHVINPIRAASPGAASLYEDGSLDFVMIDGSHQYEDVLADIKGWRPKIKPGGLLCGDDYNWKGVSQAVRESFDRVTVIEHDHRPAGKTQAKFWQVRC